MVFERLNELNDRYTELEQRMEQPEVYTDAEAYSRCARELKDLEPVIAAFRSYKDTLAAIEDARSLMDDPEMKELAQDELEHAMSRKDQLRPVRIGLPGVEKGNHTSGEVGMHLGVKPVHDQPLPMVKRVDDL